MNIRSALTFSPFCPCFRVFVPFAVLISPKMKILGMHKMQCKWVLTVLSFAEKKLNSRECRHCRMHVSFAFACNIHRAAITEQECHLETRVAACCVLLPFPNSMPPLEGPREGNHPTS